MGRGVEHRMLAWLEPSPGAGPDSVELRFMPTSKQTGSGLSWVLSRRKKNSTRMALSIAAGKTADCRDPDKLTRQNDGVRHRFQHIQ
jgi:hypothetical protein